MFLLRCFPVNYNLSYHFLAGHFIVYRIHCYLLFIETALGEGGGSRSRPVNKRQENNRGRVTSLPTLERPDTIMTPPPLYIAKGVFAEV